MKYLFVANQKPLQGYTEFCNKYTVNHKYLD